MEDTAHQDALQDVHQDTAHQNVDADTVLSEDLIVLQEDIAIQDIAKK